jgi:hypothetical protein
MPTDELLAVVGRADELYSNRAQPGAVRECVMVLSGAHGAADRYEVQWRLSRALFFLGQQAGSRNSSIELYSAGIAAGERAVALNDERVEGHFWVGVNLALFADSRGGIRGVRALWWARKELLKAARINERYHDAGPLRVLGRLAHKTPRILGGSLRASCHYFERALAIAPSNSVTLIYAAEAAIESGELDRAAALLQKVLALPDDPAWEFENQRDRGISRNLLARLASD